MPNPALTANSPSAGFIAWTAFNISYNGQTWAISAGNTNNTYTYWKYNAGAGGPLQFSNSQPTLTDDDVLLFINKGGIGINVQFAQLLDGDLILNGTLSAQAIIANAISTGQLAAGAITAAQLAAGAVTAAAIAAGAVTTDKLTVGTNADNALPNGSFYDANAAGSAPASWAPTAAGATGLVTWVTGATTSGGKQIGLTARSTDQAAIGSALIPVSPSSTWYLSASLYQTITGGTMPTVGVYFRTSFFKADGVTPCTATPSGTPARGTGAASAGQYDLISNFNVTGTATTYQGSVVAPTDASFMTVSFYNSSNGLASPNTMTLFVGDVTASKQVSTTRIQDGSITTGKIAAGAITATAIAAGSIDGMTITGATLIGGLIETASGLVAGGTTKGIAMSGGYADTIKFFTGNSTEVTPGTIAVNGINVSGEKWGTLALISPVNQLGKQAVLTLVGASQTEVTQHTLAKLEADGANAVLQLTNTDAGSFIMDTAMTFFLNSGVDLELVQSGLTYHLPRGKAASSGPQNTNTGSITTTETAYGAINNLAVTTVAGRRYLVTYSGYIASTVSLDTAIVRVRDGGGSAPTNASSLLADIPVQCVNSGGVLGHSFSFEWTPSAGAHHLGVFALRNAGSGTLTIGSATAGRNSTLTVEDIGV